MRRPATRAIAANVTLVWTVLVAGASGCTCSRGKAPGPEGEGERAGAVPGDAAQGAGGPAAAEDSAERARFSAPIAALRLPGGDVVVAGLDVDAKGVRVQRSTAAGALKVDRIALERVAWTSDADLKLFGAGDAVALVWRGKRDGKPVRELVVLGADLVVRGAPEPVGAAACATQHAFVHADGRRIAARSLVSGDVSTVDIPRDREVALACGVSRAFALLEHDDGTDLGAMDTTPSAKRPLSAASAIVTRPLLRDAELADEARERAEYLVDDELGSVRLSAAGALVVRETTGGVLGPLRRLRTAIPQDDDVVAVDASARTLVIVYTQDASDACPGASGPSTKVMALRLDRVTSAESVVELSPGVCGREVGPFYSAAAGDGVNVAWAERVPTVGKARPPIAALAHVLVPVEGSRALARIELEADALADAGCDATGCVAAALVRRPGMDAMVPGLLRVLRYAP